MNVLLCKSHFDGPVSGADETLVAYAIHAHRYGHHVRVVVLHRSRYDEQYRARLAEAGVGVDAIVPRDVVQPILAAAKATAGGILRLLRFERRLLKGIPPFSWHVAQGMLEAAYGGRCRAYFRRSQADVIHAITPTPGLAAMIQAAAAEDVPVFYQELGAPRHQPEPFAKILPLCSELAVLSPSLASEWRGRFHTKPVSVVPLLLDTSPDVPRRPTDGQSRMAFGFAARMDAPKGPLVLIDAFARVRREWPHAVLSLSGTGQQIARAMTLAQTLGIADACVFQGHYASLAGRHAFMQALDVFVLPSLLEGTPNSVIEAMSYGLPVIASAVGGIPDLVTPQTGILVPPNDGAALAEAMLQLSRDSRLRADMGRAAHARYTQLFSAEVVLPTLLNAYRRTIRRAPPAVHLPLSLAHPWSGSTEL